VSWPVTASTRLMTTSLLFLIVLITGLAAGEAIALEAPMAGNGKDAAASANVFGASAQPMHAQVTAREQDVLRERGSAAQAGWGLFLGCMAAMTVYHLALFALIRNRNDLIYALLLLIIVLFQITCDGFILAYLPQAVCAFISGKAQNALAAAGMYLFSLLVRNLLRNGAPSDRTYDRAFTAFVQFMAVCALLFLIMDSDAGFFVLKLLTLPFLILNVMTVTAALRGRSEAARYFAVALAGLTLGILVDSFLGSLLPANVLTGNAFKLGSMVFAIALSLGVGANFQRLQMESGRERTKRMQLELLYEYSRKMVSTLDPGELGEIALNGLKELTGAVQGWLFSSAGQASDPAGQKVRDIVERIGPGMKPALLSEADDLSPLGLPDGKGLYLAVPIVNQGQAMALAILLLERGIRPTDDSLNQAAMLAQHAGRAMVNAQRYMEKDLLATQDELTGLLNRRAFFERAGEECRKCAAYGKPVSVMMIDADDFKMINDTFGHAAGDRLLKKLAGVLRANLKGKDVIGRYGGEEFSVVMPNTELREAEMLAERLRREVEREGVTEGIPRFTVSIGLSEVNFCDGDDGADALAEALLRADQALYAAKRAGRNLVVRTADGTIFNHVGSTSSDGDSEK